MGLLRRVLNPVLRLDYEGRRWHAAFKALHDGIEVDSLLDLGCGDGRYTMELAEHLGVPAVRVKGGEYSQQHRERAAELFEVFPFDAETDRLPLPDESVDLVCLNQLLEHIKNVFLCLSEAERVLEIGGYLSIGTPNLGGFVNRLRLLFGAQPMCIYFPGSHIRGFTYEAMRRFLASNPTFDIVRSSGSSLYPLPPPILEGGARYLPRYSAYMFFLLRKKAHVPRCSWLDSRRGETSYND